MINIILFFTRFMFFKCFLEKLIIKYQELKKIEKIHELTALEIAQHNLKQINLYEKIGESSGLSSPKIYKQPQGRV